MGNVPMIPLAAAILFFVIMTIIVAGKFIKEVTKATQKPATTWHKIFFYFVGLCVAYELIKWVSLGFFWIMIMITKNF